MSASFDPRDLGLKPGELASVIVGDERLHPSRAFGWHHDAWLVSGNRIITKDHVANEADWDAWGPWDACQTDFKPRSRAYPPRCHAPSPGAWHLYPAPQGLSWRCVMEKQILVIVPAAGEEAEARDAAIQPGTTVADLVLATGRNPQEWGIQIKRGEGYRSLGSEEDLYQQVQDGEKVYLTIMNMDVG